MLLPISGKYSHLQVEIDKEDWDKVKKHIWWVSCKTRNNYYQVYTQVKRKTIVLSRLLIEAPSHLVVDHIDRNPLNNKKSNLRLATAAQNSYNMNMKNSNTTGVIGVDYRKDRNKYRALIRIDGRKISLGHYDTLEEAAKVRQETAREWFGKWCPVFKNVMGD